MARTRSPRRNATLISATPSAGSQTRTLSRWPRAPRVKGLLCSPANTSGAQCTRSCDNGRCPQSTSTRARASTGPIGSRVVVPQSSCGVRRCRPPATSPVPANPQSCPALEPVRWCAALAGAEPADPRAFWRQWRRPATVRPAAAAAACSQQTVRRRTVVRSPVPRRDTGDRRPPSRERWTSPVRSNGRWTTVLSSWSVIRSLGRGQQNLPGEDEVWIAAENGGVRRVPLMPGSIDLCVSGFAGQLPRRDRPQGVAAQHHDLAAANPGAGRPIDIHRRRWLFFRPVPRRVAASGGVGASGGSGASGRRWRRRARGARHSAELIRGPAVRPVEVHRAEIRHGAGPGLCRACSELDRRPLDGDPTPGRVSRSDELLTARVPLVRVCLMRGAGSGGRGCRCSVPGHSGHHGCADDSEYEPARESGCDPGQNQPADSACSAREPPDTDAEGNSRRPHQQDPYCRRGDCQHRRLPDRTDVRTRLGRAGHCADRRPWHW